MEHKVPDKVNEQTGYSVQWLVDSTNVTEFICLCCRGIVRNHRELPCCDILCCLACLERVGKCPKCSKPVRYFELLVHSKRVQKKVHDLKARCPFDSTEGGDKTCLWGKDEEQKLKDTDTHIEECPFAPKKCKICPAFVVSDSLEAHNEKEIKLHVELLEKQVELLKLNQKKRVRHLYLFRMKYVQNYYVWNESNTFIPIPIEGYETPNRVIKYARDTGLRQWISSDQVRFWYREKDHPNRKLLTWQYVQTCNYDEKISDTAEVLLETRRILEAVKGAKQYNFPMSL